MHCIKYNRFPNNEIRATHYYLSSRVDFCVGVDEPEPPSRVLSETFSEAPSAVSGSSTFLDISSDFAQSGFGRMGKRTKFGTNARRTIMRMGGALDTMDPTPSNYVFLTGTLPGGTHEVFMSISKQSGWAVKMLQNWLNRTIKSEYWFYVWELQKRGALHLHYCAYIPNTLQRNKLVSDFPQKWSDIIDGVGKREGVDMWQRADGTTHAQNKGVLQAYAQTVEKSVAAYMAGYCSDGKNKHRADELSPYYPVRWWGASRKLSNLLKGLTEEVVVQHTNYRGARTEMTRWENSIPSNTPLVYTYQHGAGIGSTVVSYHPDDKGLEQWSRLKPMMYNPSEFPNTSSMILHLHQTLKDYPLCLRVLRKHKLESLHPLLRDLEDSTFADSLLRFTVSVQHLRILDLCLSELSLNALARYNPERTATIYTPCVWAWNQNRAACRWNRDGWLNLDKDLPMLLTDCWSLR